MTRTPTPGAAFAHYFVPTVEAAFPGPQGHKGERTRQHRGADRGRSRRSCVPTCACWAATTLTRASLSHARPFARPPRGGRYRSKKERCWKRKPSKTSSTRASESDPILPLRRLFSTEEICETTTTLCLVRPPSPRSSRTFPGQLARRTLDVSAHTTTVATREWLKTSSWTTTLGWGWRETGPHGLSGPTQNTSPRSIRAERSLWAA
jgi:hypothetical protein